MIKELKDYNWVGTIFSSNILVFGTKNPDSPCANKQVREALDYAIDREALAAALSYGMWGPTYQIPAPDNGAIYDPNYVYPRPYDPEKAKQLLAEAGYASGLKVTIYSAPIPTDPGIIAAIQGMWKEVGVDCELVYCKIQPEWNDADKANAPGTILFEPMGPMGNYNNGLAFGFNAMMDIWNACWLRTPEYIDLYRNEHEHAGVRPDALQGHHRLHDERRVGARCDRRRQGLDGRERHQGPRFPHPHLLPVVEPGSCLYSEVESDQANPPPLPGGASTCLGGPTWEPVGEREAAPGGIRP